MVQMAVDLSKAYPAASGVAEGKVSLDEHQNEGATSKAA